LADGYLALPIKFGGSMKVKSFVTGTANGLSVAFEFLDEQIAKELRGVKIHDVKDTPYPSDALTHTLPKGVDHIVRVVTYS
jgi:hypothetical protein